MDETNDKELLAMLIDIYTNLQRIKTAEDRDKEIDYQIKAAKAKLEIHGIVPERFDICCAENTTPITEGGC